MASKRPVHSLLYGDVIFLHCKTGGYVFSEVSSTTCGSIIVYPASSKDEDDPTFPNLKMGAFKVLAADKVKAQQRLTDIRKTLLTQRKGTTKLSTEEKELIQSAERNAEVERRNNKDEQERVAGTPVLYGNTVQLLHVFSGKYAAVNPVEISKTENINLQAELMTNNSEHAFFKILPRYKVKSIGHEVYLHDQVTFGVVKSTEGQYLHTSKMTFHDVGIALYGECHEVNVANVPSGYTLKPHYHGTLDNESKNIVKAGSIIRLFHREVEYYLVAEGSFANSKGEVMMEDVHLRKRKSDDGRLRPPSTSAVTYWQIEKERTLSGEPMIWEERCRIKHVPTRMYLAVVRHEDSSLKVTLKDKDVNKTDLDIVFRLIPVIEEGSEVIFESYTRINHPLTNSWLNAKNSEYVKQSFDHNATGLNALQWDTADLKEIGVTSEMKYHEAFTVEKVDDSLIQKLNCIAEVIPIIKTYIEERERDPEKLTNFQDAYVMIEALDVMAKFIGSGHADLLDRQKLLRNLKVIELIIETLKVHNPELSQDSPQHKVSKACYQLLEVYLRGKSGKNNVYLARFIPLFRKHIGFDLNVEDMMIELIRDYEEIILSYEPEDMSDIIDHLLQTKDSRFMDFLSALCVCNGQPIVEHQDYIVENLLYKHSKKLFYSTEVGSDLPIQTGSPYTIYFCKPDELAWNSVHSVAPGSRDFQFILAQLNLFGALCKGNNRKAIEAIDKDFKFVSFKEALTGAKDANLDYNLRSKYVELIIVLYVDVNNDNRSLLEDLSLSFNYSELRENPYEEASKNPTIALTGAENVHFPDLRDWIQDHVASQQNVIGGKEMMNSNTFNANVIDLLHLLVKYGYYANLADIKSLMPLLISLLDGLNDKPSIQFSKDELEDFTKVGRFKDTEENRPVFNLKVKVLKTVNLFFNFRSYLRLQNYIFDYKLLKSGTQATRLLSSSSPSHSTFSDYQEYSHHSHQYPLPPAQLAQLECSPEKFSIHSNKHLMAMAVNRLEKLFSFSEYVYEKSGQHTVSLPKVLLDLAEYESDEILSESLHLLNRYYSSEDTLFEQAIQTQLLINPNSKKVLAEVTNELLPALRHLALKDITEKQFQELIKILRKLISFCHLKDAVHEPHYQNQQILYNTGVFSDMMNLIFRKKFKPKSAKLNWDEVGKSQHEIIVSTSLQFLKMLARNHKVVQERLFDSMDKFLSLKVALPDVGEMLTEVFTGVKETCLKIEEKHIIKIFKLIATHNGCPELLEMLQAVVKAEDLDLPLKQNQTVIVKHFNLNRDKFCDYFLGKEPEKEQKRESILLYAEDSDHDLQVVLKVFGLLAACCEGENLFIESICQNIISISELMKILNNHKIKPDRKKPFALLLLWGYINTGKDAALTGSMELTHSLEMWHYLEHINIVLNGVIRVLSNLPKAQVASMKLASNPQLRRRTMKAVHIDGGRSKEIGKVVTSHSNIPYVTNSSGEMIPGVLQYVMEGVLPLIKVYYVQLFDPYKPDQSVYQKEIQVSANIATTLLHLEDVMVTNNHFSSQEHWKTLCDTIITIISHNCYNEGMIDVDIDIKARFNERMQARFNDHVDYKVVAQGATTKVHLQEYEQEKKLNENFNNFVQNFQLAYWGPNTAEHQIGSPYKTTYSEFVAGAEFKEKGDEWLPLGLTYQKHVACFVSHQQSKTTVLPVTKRVIDYLLASYNSFSHLSEKEKLHLRLHNIKYLQLLRTIIHNEIMFTDPTLREQGQDPQEFRRQSERVRAVQDQIQEYGNGSTITELVKLLLHPDESISAEVLAFLTILLYSGNSNIQNSFSSYVCSTREEKFFVSMQQRLEQAAHNDSERRELLVQLKLKHTEELILKDLFNEYAVQYGFRKASLSLFAQPSVKRLSYNEEDAFGIHSSRRKLLESSDNLAMELQEIGSKRKQVTFNHTSALYTKPGTTTARRLSLSQLQPTTLWREILPSIRVAKEEIQQQKHEGKPVEKSAEKGKLETLKFRDTSYIELALRFLGLLCDGQNKIIQNYFREQPDNIKTINLVSETCVFLQSFYVEVTKENIDLINEILLTLIEMCVGNFANQKVMYNHHIIDVVNRLLQTTLFQQCTLPKVLKLKSTAIKILEIMCEETSTQTKDLVKNIFKAVDVDTLHTSLAYFHKLSQDEEMKHLQENDNAERAMFAMYHILRHFADFQDISMEMISPRSRDENTSAARYRDVNKAWKLCEKQSKSIELLYEGEDGESTLAKVHFNVPESSELSEEIKEKVKFNVDRSSPEDKIRDFSKWIESVKWEVQHLNYLRAHWYTKIFMINMRWRNHVLFWWTVLLNILMLIAWDDSLPQRVVNGTEIDVPTVPRQDDNWFFSFVLYIGGGIHLLISLAVVITYFLINGSNFVMPDFFYRILRRKHEPSYSDVPFFGLRTMYHIAFVGCSALSLVFYGYLYCLCLFHVVVDNDILQRVLKSVTKNGRSLLWVAILGLIVIYNYAVGTFIFMPNEFDNQEGEVGEAVRYCHTLFECSITVLEYGLLDTIGLTVDLPTNFKDATLRAIFFDLTFFIIVTTIGLNIVFGIIVDTFSELRDERYNIEQDKNGFCFICNIPSFEFERRAEGFDHHVKKEHCMWDYIYYIMYLEGIDISDHNALEHYVHCQINRDDKTTGYFPLFQARSLREKKDDALTELGELKKMMSIIVEHHEEMQRTEAIRKHKEDQAEWERKYQTEQMDEQFSHI